MSRRAHGPLFRFDPHPAGAHRTHDGYGVWYGAMQLSVALLEVFNRSPDSPVRADVCSSYRGSLLEVDEATSLVDLVNPAHVEALSASIELGRSTQADYEVTQAWARALHAEGVDGLRYASARSLHEGGVATVLFQPRLARVLAQHQLHDDTLWPLVMSVLDAAGVPYRRVSSCERCT